jgi:hypothetical protein
MLNRKLGILFVPNTMAHIDIKEAKINNSCTQDLEYFFVVKLV